MHDTDPLGSAQGDAARRDAEKALLVQSDNGPRPADGPPPAQPDFSGDSHDLPLTEEGP